MARGLACCSLIAGALLLGAGPAAADCPEITILVDNDIPGSGYSEDMPHNWASRSPGACYTTYRYLSHDDTAAPQNDGTRTGRAVWQPTITVSGTYEITISYRATTNRTNDADYYVYDDLGGVYHQVVDQAHEGDCTHVTLGVFYCAAGGQCRVVLDGTDDGLSDAADGTTFVLITCDDPPDPGPCDPIANHPDYELCNQGVSTCSGVFTNGDGCLAFCAAAGMECVARFGGEPGCQMEPQNAMACDATNGHLSDWCDCRYPPGLDGGVVGPDAGASTDAAVGPGPDSGAAGDAGPARDASQQPADALAGADAATDPDESVGTGCGCRSPGRGSAPLVYALFVLLWLGWRRRSRSAPAAPRRASPPRTSVP